MKNKIQNLQEAYKREKIETVLQVGTRKNRDP